jgi:hypothetical protein
MDRVSKPHSPLPDHSEHLPKALLNAYRALLTLARQDLIVFVPNGDAKDPTRPPAFCDET